jgi:hypothetical protein
VGIKYYMHFKDKKINGKVYRYAVKSVRLPNGKKISLEVIYKGQNNAELEKILLEKEKLENIKYAVKNLKQTIFFQKKN